MKHKICAGILAFLLLISMTACDSGEETTVTGMVVSIEGTVISLVEMDPNRDNNTSNGERPAKPDGFGGERPEGFGGELPEDFDGTMPNGEKFPQWNTDGERPTMPEGETMPSMPENGERPSFDGQNGERPGFENFMKNMETTQIDIGDAHISIEEDGVRASGSLSDVKVGAFVTITKDGKGKVTNVLITSASGFGSGFRGGNFKGGNNAGQAQNG